jgi:hypothetical protein
VLATKKKKKFFFLTILSMEATAKFVISAEDDDF